MSGWHVASLCMYIVCMVALYVCNVYDMSGWHVASLCMYVMCMMLAGGMWHHCVCM